MLWFFFCIAVLLVGYVIYGKVIERIFVINPNKNTPAYTMADGVDYVPMSKKKIWLIQLLNIAGTGPILARFWVLCMALWRCYGLSSAVFLPVRCMTICVVCSRCAMVVHRCHI